MTFVQGDKIRIKDNTSLRYMYRGQEGVVKTWHSDDIYTVEVCGVHLTVFANEMEKVDEL